MRALRAMMSRRAAVLYLMPFLLTVESCWLLDGCMSKGRGWSFKIIVPNGFEISYENLEQIAGRDYTNIQTFHPEGLNLLTANIQQLKTDPNLELTEEQAVYVAGLETAIEAQRVKIAEQNATIAAMERRLDAEGDR